MLKSVFISVIPKSFGQALRNSKTTPLAFRNYSEPKKVWPKESLQRFKSAMASIDR